MSLPFILDIATGLIFIYLILSMLASEIQELLATILQWRAKHLKRSIATLLAGGSQGSEDTEIINQAIELTNLLYKDPLINTLNYEEKGLIGSLSRQAFRFFESRFDVVFNRANQLLNRHNANVLNKRNSAPSYIPNETFATTLLETLKLPELIQELSKESLVNFQQKQIGLIESYLKTINDDPDINQDAKSKCEEEFQKLQNSFKNIYQDLEGRKANLRTSINRMIERLDNYIEDAGDVLPDSLTTRRFIRQLKLIRKDTFSNTTESVWQGGLHPNLALVIKAYKEVKDGVEDANTPLHQKIKELKLEGANLEEKLIDRLPKSLTDSLAVLANRAQIKIDDVEEGMKQFKQEIETWFDRSMERSSGVYRRNSKGVAIIIGFLIAVAANADTLHIVSRLSKDSALRATITQNSNQASQDCPPPSNNPNNLRSNNLGCLVRTVDQTLTDVSLPVGWTESNRNQQLNLTYSANNNSANSTLAPVWQILKVIGGWILSSIAIAMGAPFWFDLLGRIVNVRNTGGRPTSSAEKQGRSQD